MNAPAQVNRVIALVKAAVKSSDCVAQTALLMGTAGSTAPDVGAQMQEIVLHQVATCLQEGGFPVLVFGHTLHATSYIRSYSPEFHSLCLHDTHFDLAGRKGLDALMDSQRHRLGQDRIITQRLESRQLPLKRTNRQHDCFVALYRAIEASLTGLSASQINAATPAVLGHRTIMRP